MSKRFLLAHGAFFQSASHFLKLYTDLPVERIDLKSENVDDTKGTLREYFTQYSEALKDSIHHCHAMNHENDILVVPHTVVYTQRQILSSPKNQRDQARQLNMLSGRRHQVATHILIQYKEKCIEKIVKTTVQFKRFSLQEKSNLDLFNDGISFPGGYNANGFGAGLIQAIIGSPSNLQGFPIFEIRNMLIGIGAPIR